MYLAYGILLTALMRSVKVINTGYKYTYRPTPPRSLILMQQSRPLFSGATQGQVVAGGAPMVSILPTF